MTHFRKLRDERFLGSWDFEDPDSQKKPLVMERFERMEVFNAQDQTTHKEPTVFFEGIGKGMILNITNLKTLAALYGDQYEEWIGKPVLVEVKEVRAFGDIHQALRIKPERITAQSAPSQPAEPAPKPRAQTEKSKAKEVKDQLWSLLSHVHNNADRRDSYAMKSALAKVNQHLWDEGYMRENETLANLSLDRMEEIITLLKQAEEL